MDTNVDGIDGASKEIDEQEEGNNNNYGTFSDIAAQEQEVYIVSTGKQPAAAATDEFKNKDMQPPHQQQSPVLIDIEEEVIHSTLLIGIITMEEHNREEGEDINFLRHYSFFLLLWQLHWEHYWVETTDHRVILMLLVRL